MVPFVIRVFFLPYNGFCDVFGTSRTDLGSFEGIFIYVYLSGRQWADMAADALGARLLADVEEEGLGEVSFSTLFLLHVSFQLEPCSHSYPREFVDPIPIVSHI